MNEDQAEWMQSPKKRILRDSKIEKWQGWLEEKIRPEIITM